MARISEAMIEQIRSQNDIVDIVSEYVQLNRQGRNLVGKCPFHDENTPSFSVSPDKQLYHCFGCKESGNVITFIMNIENYDFLEAIRFLGEKVGVSLPERTSISQVHRSDIDEKGIQAFDWLTKFYHHMLKHSKESDDAKQYLASRDIELESIEKFQIGFAPNTSDFTVDFLNKKGFTNGELIQRELMRETKSGELVDRFRNRIVFPIRNYQGKTVAFGARSIHGEHPKYLNSPETDLFQKGKILYNFDLAQRHIRKNKTAVLCEGYIDVISCDFAGIPNSIATLGTALTENQARILQRYAETVIICYDNDEAGLKATKKAGQLLERIGLHVKVAQLEQGMDPDQHIKTYGAEAFRTNVIDNSDSFHTFYLQYIKKDYNMNIEADRIRYVETVIQRIATIEKVIEREYYLKELADEFNMTFLTLQEQVEHIRKRQRTGPNQSEYVSSNEREKSKQFKKTKHMIHVSPLLPAYQRAERNLLAHMLHDISIAKRVEDIIGARFNVEVHQVIVTYLYAFYEENQEENITKFVERLPESNLQELVQELSTITIDSSVSNQVITDYIDVILNEQSEKKSIQQLKEAQKEAEKQGDPIRAAQIAIQIIELQNKK